MPTNLPRDDSFAAIQALAPDDGEVVYAAISTTSEKVALPEGLVYEISFDTPVHLRTGTTSVTAATTESRYLPAGSYVYSKKPTDTHIHIRTASGTGIVTITGMQ